jgi:SNF2 family DNA or RNA helicase
MPNRKIYEYFELDLPPKLQTAYNKAESEFVIEYDGKQLDSTMYSIKQYSWLRRMANGWVGKDLVWDGKVNECIRIIKEQVGKQQIIVWFAFNDDMAAVKDALVANGIVTDFIHGDVPPFQRDAVLDNFRAKKFDVILLQHQIGQYGLDLSNVDTAIFYNAVPSFNLRSQSEDRMIHPKKKSPLLYLDIVARGTVDFDIMMSLYDKGVNSDETLHKAILSRLQNRRNKS